VVETLARTGRSSTRIARHRFFETFQHVLESTKFLADIQPGGASHVSGRKRILKLVELNPQYYDLQAFGVPINNLLKDMKGTTFFSPETGYGTCLNTAQIRWLAIPTYSTNLMFLQLPRQSIYPRKQEVEDYIALFRYIAHILRTPTEALETPKKAKAWMESIMLTEIDPTETSKILASNIIKYLEGTRPVCVSKEFLEAGSRWLNSNELYDGLGLGNPDYYYLALMARQCWLSMLVAYTARAIPLLDEKQILYFRQLLYDYIVEGEILRGPSRFDYKYVPDTGKMTTYEEDTQRPDEAKRAFSFETVDLYAFVVGYVAFLLAGLAGLKLSVAVSKNLIAFVRQAHNRNIFWLSISALAALALAPVDSDFTAKHFRIPQSTNIALGLGGLDDNDIRSIRSGDPPSRLNYKIRITNGSLPLDIKAGDPSGHEIFRRADVAEAQAERTVSSAAPNINVQETPGAVPTLNEVMMVIICGLSDIALYEKNSRTMMNQFVAVFASYRGKLNMLASVVCFSYGSRMDS
ncbi:MAG: hypothetical protein LQ343_002221, partial [Gyalolechia ehrenbergii]